MLEYDSINTKFPEPVSFSYAIEIFLKDNKCVSYVDAIIKYCSINNIDIEDIIELIGPTLKAKLESEAAEYGVLIKGLSSPMFKFD